jgi:hypothetical protein
MQFHLAQRRRASPGAASQPNSGRRKKRMAVVRLGGEGRKRRFFGVLRTRLRWPWLAAVYRRALRRLRASYEQALRELVDGNVLVGTLHAPAGVNRAHAPPSGPWPPSGSELR